MMQVLFGLQHPGHGQEFAKKRGEWRVLLSERGKGCEPHGADARDAE
jgi:hypothetical protein